MNTTHKADGLPPHEEATADDVNFPDMSEFSISIIGPGAVFKGDVISERGISIFGNVLGNVICHDGLLHVGDTGVVTGNIEGYNVEVDGLVEGNVLARHTLRINGRIRGEMRYMVELFVAPHLDIDGHIRKVKADAPGDLASQQPVSFVASPVLPKSMQASQVPPADQPYAPPGYVHVTRTTASESTPQVSQAPIREKAAQADQKQQPANGYGGYGAGQTRPLHRVV
jgi:cytoskeletal protein CcmA (bactofilin family)